MTVAELIDLLREFPQQAEVVMSGDADSAGGTINTVEYQAFFGQHPYPLRPVVRGVVTLSGRVLNA